MIYFTPTANVDYLISGAYAAQDDDGRQFGLYAQIYDTTTSTQIYRSDQESFSTSNESFVLGGSGGDTNNFSFGSPAGTLIGGHTYFVYFDAGIVAYPTESSVQADASGYVTLAFVPEPNTAALVIAGLLGLAGWRRASD